MNALAFEDIRWLLIMIAAIPLAVLAIRLLREMDALRRRIAIALRVAVIVVLALLLAGPLHRSAHDNLTVVALLDISESMKAYAEVPDRAGIVRGDGLAALRQWLTDASEVRGEADRFGMILFAGDSTVVRAPSSRATPDVPIDADLPAGTDLAGAIRLGLALLPADTAKRLVVISDGNETIGEARNAARLAVDTTAAESVSIPIDVLPIDFGEVRDVRVVRVDVPPSGRPGQRVRVRIVLESTHATTGRLVLRQEGRPVDLDPSSDDFARTIRVARGTTIETADVDLSPRPVNRFEATFEPDEPRMDLVRTNNRAAAFTVTPSGGSVLIVRDQAEPGRLDQLLFAADISAEVIAPEQLPEHLLDLQNADLVVLENVAASRFNQEQMRALVTHVTDFGAGLLMTGGYDGFGAGAWQNTLVSEILPLELDPPRELRAPRAALVFVIDVSGSMNFPVSGARATQMDLAIVSTNRAIDSLQDDALVGVVTFNMDASVVVPLQRLDNRPAIAAQVSSMQAGGGTFIGSGLRRGIEMLRTTETERRIMVLLSDGVSQPDDYEAILEELQREDIRLSTIALGDQTDLALLRRLAEEGGGEFLAAINPRTLPRVLVDSVRIVNRPLVREGAFTPIVLPTGSQLTPPLASAPPLTGLVITARLDDPLATVELVHPDGEPLFAWWQRGLGRVAGFTGELDGQWSQEWSTWERADAFWVELVRLLARPAGSSDLEVVVRPRSGALNIVLLTDETGDDLLGGLSVTGTVYAPSGRTSPVQLTEVVPGRYAVDHPVDELGPHIVALTPRRGNEALPPVLGGSVIEESAELARSAPDHQLLAQLAEMTGGRVLSVRDALGSPLFEREGLPTFLSFGSLHTPLLSLLIALLLLDIAGRRIAWRGADVTEAGQRLLQPVRATTTGATQSAVLRKIRPATAGSAGGSAGAPGSAATTDSPAATAAALRSPGLARGASDESPRSDDAAHVPDAHEINRAIDALTGRESADDAESRGADSSASKAPPPKPKPGPDTPADEAPGSSMRSNLRAARDRARHRHGSDPDQS